MRTMPYSLYVCLQDDNKIVAFNLDADSGGLTPQAETPVSGGPFALSISPDRHVLYVAHRIAPAISSFRIDHATGGLKLQGTVAAEHAPTYLAADRTGKYLLSAYYQGGYAMVHPLSAGWLLPPAPMPYRPIAPTALRSCRTSPVSMITSWNLLRGSPALI